MSRKITISIPSSDGEQLFYITRKTALIILSSIILITCTAASYLYTTWRSQQNTQDDYQQLLNQVRQTEQQKSELEQQYNEQLDVAHSLSLELEEKQTQLQTLGKRVFDVESVLGISRTEESNNERSLEERVDAAAIDSAVRATMFRMIPNDTPLEYNRVSSPFGRRINPISGQRRMHSGVDLTCDMGSAIYAPADGVIESARPSTGGFGNYVTMRHAFGFTSSYAHLAKFHVRRGEFVRKGQKIANCGNSGNSTGPHLHYEVHFLGRPLNPENTMTWTPDNFDSLFEKEKKVTWGPLVKMIDDVVRLQVTLTNNATPPLNLDTVKSDTTTETELTTN
ncbi:M23 family metallopeptidase [Vibrio sp. NTOU-M3]|uniref:M23 family metallopeptidase n=1 Tax=Vibrio sp. NTOU-M3 TaxID=3234954 RepID=UPI00349F2AEA